MFGRRGFTPSFQDSGNLNANSTWGYVAHRGRCLLHPRLRVLRPFGTERFPDQPKGRRWRERDAAQRASAAADRLAAAQGHDCPQLDWGDGTIHAT